MNEKQIELFKNYMRISFKEGIRYGKNYSSIGFDEHWDSEFKHFVKSISDIKEVDTSEKITELITDVIYSDCNHNFEVIDDDFDKCTICGLKVSNH